jgi:hypothetical protein
VACPLLDYALPGTHPTWSTLQTPHGSPTPCAKHKKHKEWDPSLGTLKKAKLYKVWHRVGVARSSSRFQRIVAIKLGNIVAETKAAPVGSAGTAKGKPKR